MKKILCTTALTIAVASQASAATINEIDYGDFGNDEASITDVGSLDEGVNAVTGTLSSGLFCTISAVGGIGGCGSSDLVDAISFVVPDGYEMVSASISSLGIGGEYAAGLYDFDTLSELAGDEFAVGDGGSIDDGQVLPAGKYVFAIQASAFLPQVVALKAAGDIYSPFFMNYEGTAVLKAVDGGPQVVPLPAGMPLILGALAMLGIAGRRRA